MKKAIAISVILSFIICLCSCKNTGTAGTETKDNIQQTTVPVSDIPDELIQKTENAWIDYVSASEIRYRSIEWATDYVLDYCKEKNTAAFRRAVAALESAIAALNDLSLPELLLTTDDIAQATEYDLDISYIGSYYSAFSDSVAREISIMNDLLEYFIENAVWEYGVEYIELSASFNNSKAKYDIEELILSTNYLMLSLGKDCYSSKLPEACSSLFSASTEFITDIPTLEAKINECLDNLQELSKSQAETESTLIANESMLSTAINSEEWDNVYTLAINIGNRNDSVFLPEITNQYSIATYFYDSVNEEIEWTVAGSDLSDMPTGLLITYKNVSEDDFINYIDTLTMIWWQIYDSEITDTESDYILSNGESVISVSYKAGKLSILISDTTTYICPDWYILYLIS